MGYVLTLEALLLLLPCIVALYYNEQEGYAYLASSAICLVLGGAMSLKKPKSNVFYLKEGCVATALSWIVLSVFGAIPFVLTGEIPHFVDALFETVSGFTTTGASILSDVETLANCTLFWRSFTHWIGGMGVLVFILAMIPLSGGSNMNLMKAESPGPSVSKIVPKIRKTAALLYVIYFTMTLIEIVFLLCGKMHFLESVLTAFGTAGTGGFGFRNDSFASFSPYIQWVVTIFMILFGVNFNAYYLLLFRQFKKAFSLEEVKGYAAIIIVSIGLVFSNTIHLYNTVSEALCKASFQVASIITTTGFSTADFNTWSSTSKTVLVVLMFIGACAGSTGGGMKVSRFLLSVKSALRELNSYLFPKSIKKIKMDGKTVDEEAIRGINVYFTAYMLLVILSTFLVCIDGTDLVSGFSSVLGTFNNIGPGLAKYGPACNFGVASTFSKCVYIFDMLAGRLEIFPVLILLYPPSWRGLLKRRIKRKKNSRTNISVS